MVTSISTFLDTMVRPLWRYSDFRGRSDRLEYWLFAFFIFGLVIAMAVGLGIVRAVTGLSTADGSFLNGLGIFVFGLFFVITLVPSLAVTVRRLHDQGRSGRFLLLLIVPGIGACVLMVLMLLPGEHRANRYGPPPSATA